MKKIISVLVLMCFMTQFFAVASYAEAQTIYELDLSGVTLGNYEKNKLSMTATCSITANEDEATGEKYLSIVDADPSVAAGFYEAGIQLSDVTTVSYDFRVLRGGVNMYLSGTGHPVSVILSSPILYYTKAGGGTTSTDAGVLTGEEWVNITCVIRKNENKFDLYKNGLVAVKGANFREGAVFGTTMMFNLYSSQAGVHTEFDLKNLKVYSGEVIPEMTERIPLKPEYNLVDYVGAPKRLDNALSNAVAMSVGNSMARVNNSYVHIDPDNVYVAPFITEDGYTLIPTRFTTETIGCSVEVLSSTSFRFSKDGTVMEINMGDKNAIINGVPTPMPTTPVIKYDRLFIPLRFAAETYGKKVFWDDRGLIIISDGDVVKAGQEDIIKPLLSEIRQYTTLYGNRKYSDVNYSSRYFRKDGHTTGTDKSQWGTLDAAKRFMATVNRWSYVLTGDDSKAQLDQGLLVQGTLNATFVDHEKTFSAYFPDGTEYVRSDGMKGWGCVNDPDFRQNLFDRARSGIDNGFFAWQFDDYLINYHYHRNGGCFCDYCVKGFANYLSTKVSAEKLAEAGVTDPANFNYKKHLPEMGITKAKDYASIANLTPIGQLWLEYNLKTIEQFHKELVEYMESYAGNEVYYSINCANFVDGVVPGEYIYQLVDSVMGETNSSGTDAAAVYAAMLFSRGIGIENVISPLPHGEADKRLIYSAIPMCYATGQYMLIPWDTWLVGTTRYYATLEELGSCYELPREYPYLFDNYEIPEIIGYVYDMDKMKEITTEGSKHLEKNLPVRAVIHNTLLEKTVNEKDLKGLQALIPGNDISSLTDEELKTIENSGVLLVKADDTASIEYLENTYWMTKSNNEKLYTVLRQNQLFDNAPTVVHAVNYNTDVCTNAEVEINNLYLPQGDEFTVDVYKPGENYKTITVKKGNGSTKIKLDSVDKWTILEISGPSTVRRGASFKLEAGYNGIGTGTRVSNDKLYGRTEDFTIVTYGEGINGTTFNDEGTQDEISYVYTRLGKGTLKTAFASAEFETTNATYGAMVRDGIYSNARFAAIMYDDVNGLRMAVREVANEGVKYTNISKTKPRYMKLMRDHRTYRAYVSDDGDNYTEVASADIVFEQPVIGVFASSPNGSRAECRVKDFIADEGSYPSGTFDEFAIKSPGVVTTADVGKKLVMDLTVGNATGLTANDVKITFTSSDEGVAKILPDGTIIPVSSGQTKITANAVMGLRKASTSTVLKITDVDPLMFEEQFKTAEVPTYIKNISQGKYSISNGAISISADVNGHECDPTFSFKQYNLPTAFEFDFRAKFGTASPTTGARVAYIHGSAISLTAEKSGFNWFFGNDQRHIMPIQEDKWYHIRIEADYKAQTASVYIDGNLVVENAPCRSAISADGSVRFGGWRIGTDSRYEWDNFKITVKK